MDRGLLLNQEMVKAALDGRKTQTRRLCKPQPVHQNGKMFIIECERDQWAFESGINGSIKTPIDHSEVCEKAPLGKAGDRLYVRERARLIGGSAKGKMRFEYEADGTKSDWIQKPDRIKMTPYMIGHCCSNGCFKELARIWFEIVGVRVERVQDISCEDIMKEGITDDKPKVCAGMMVHDTTILRYKWRKLWQSLYPGSWERNDWVFAYDLKRISTPVED